MLQRSPLKLSGHAPTKYKPQSLVLGLGKIKFVDSNIKVMRNKVTDFTIMIIQSKVGEKQL